MFAENRDLKGFSLWAKNAKEGFTQIREMVIGASGHIRNLKVSDKAILLGFTALTVAVTGGAALWAGPASAAIQLLGFGASGLALINQRLQYNHHKLAVQPVVGIGMTAQQALLGGYGYAVMAAVAGLRAWTFSMIPETPKLAKLRTGIALGYAGIGMGLITVLSVATGRYENMLTVPSMLMGTVADRMPSSENAAKDFTRHARLLRMLANGNNALFNAFVSGSWAGLFSDGLATANLKNAIRDYDVPVAQRDGTKMGKAESVRAYMRSILKVEPIQGLTPNMLQSMPTVVRSSPVDERGPSAMVTTRRELPRAIGLNLVKVFQSLNATQNDALVPTPTRIASVEPTAPRV